MNKVRHSIHNHIDSNLLHRMEQVARYIESRYDETLTLATLAKVAQMSASHLQKSFKRTFGISPKAFQDELRTSKLKQNLKQGKNISEAIYEAGFGSSSRVYENENSRLGLSPGKYKEGAPNELIVYAFIETSLGMMIMAASDKGICCVQFGDDQQQLLAALHKEFPRASLQPTDNHHTPEFSKWMEALKQHLQRNAPLPELPLDLRGTAFQTLVWNFLRTIPSGTTCSYQELASSIGKAGAARAAGSACGANRVAILIPCHRVLRGDGGQGGSRWGLERKQAILALEQEMKAGPA